MIRLQMEKYTDPHSHGLAQTHAAIHFAMGVEAIHMVFINCVFFSQLIYFTIHTMLTPFLSKACLMQHMQPLGALQLSSVHIY